MTLKDLVKKAWQDAGLYKSKSAELQSFLDYFEASTPGCWSDVANELRARCPDEKGQLVMAIWNLGEQSFRVALIESLDENKDDERELLHKLAKACHPIQDAFPLQLILHKDHPDLLASVEEAMSTEGAAAPAAFGPMGKEAPAAAQGRFGALRMLLALKREQQTG